MFFVETIQHRSYVFNRLNFDKTNSVIDITSPKCYFLKIRNKWSFQFYQEYDLAWSKSSSFISFLTNDDVNSWLVYILLRIISIVVSNGTLVNSDLTSKDTIWNPSGTFLCLIISIKCLVLLMVYSDSLKGDNIFDKCFANWYVAVFKFDTIGLIGSWSMLPFLGTLWILAVP